MPPIIMTTTQTRPSTPMTALIILVTSETRVFSCPPTGFGVGSDEFFLFHKLNGHIFKILLLFDFIVQFFLEKSNNYYSAGAFRATRITQFTMAKARAQTTMPMVA